MRDDLEKRIISTLVDLDSQQVNSIMNRIRVIIDDYEIAPKSSEIVVYDKTNNINLVGNFLIHCRLKNLTPRTLKAYAQSLHRWDRKIKKDFIDYEASDIRSRLASLIVKEQASTNYVLNELRCLSSFFTWLHNEGIISANPIAKVEKPKKGKRKKEAFTGLEIEMMRDILDNSFKKALFELLLSTGCRISEACSIKISEINNNKIKVVGKGNKERFVYLSSRAQLAIKQFLSERKDNNQYLFPSGINIMRGRATKEWYKDPTFVSLEGHYDACSAESMIRRIGKKAKVGNAHPHKFRRTFATDALSRGMPILTVSKLLGHESLDTTQIYLEVNEAELERAHEKYIA